MVDEEPHLTKEERRQRQKRLEQTRRQARHKADQGSPVSHASPAGPGGDVDGTLLSALPLLNKAMLLKEQTGSGLVKWRLHTHFEVTPGVPARVEVTGNGGGEDDERAVLDRTLEADRLYVFDRGYAKFALFNHIVKAQSSYVDRHAPSLAACRLGHLAQGDGGRRPLGTVRKRG